MMISAVLIVKNESKKLERCLKSLIDYVDEIVIVDTGSTDDTVGIASKYTNNIHYYEWNNNFSEARNYALSHSGGDYNLTIDADEHITFFSKDEIVKFLGKSPKLGVVNIKNIIEQDGQKQAKVEYITRLIPKGTTYIGSIHEQVDSNYEKVVLPIEITHDGYFQRTREKFLRNISLLEKEYSRNTNDEYIMYQLSSEYFGLKEYDRAGFYFKNCYDVINSKSSVFHFFITNYILYCIAIKDYFTGLEIIRANEKRLDIYADFHFISAGFYLEFVLSNIEENMDYISKIEICYKKCLEIGESSTLSTLVGAGSFLALYNLGVFYECFNFINEAKICYQESLELGYQKAEERLLELNG